jgi:hypothetical protein
MRPAGLIQALGTSQSLCKLLFPVQPATNSLGDSMGCTCFHSPQPLLIPRSQEEYHFMLLVRFNEFLLPHHGAGFHFAGAILCLAFSSNDRSMREFSWHALKTRAFAASSEYNLSQLHTWETHVAPGAHSELMVSFHIIPIYYGLLITSRIFMYFHSLRFSIR